MSVIAIDLGGTKIAGALFDDRGNKLFHNKAFLEGRGGEEVGSLIVGLVQEILAVAAEKQQPVEGIGVCVPGIASSKTHCVWAPNIPGWEHFPLKERLQAVLPASVRVCVESDRTCHILGELWQGAAQNCQNAVFVAVGTGIGMGLLIDGHIVHGQSDIVGASGWMALEPPYLSEYDACGCFESSASGQGLGARAREMLQNDASYQGPLREKPLEEISAYDVFAHYDAGDPIARAVLHKAITYWGMAAANIVSLLNPEMVVWGGGLFGPACRFIDDIYAEALKWAQPISIRQTRFVATQVEEAGLVGAAYLAMGFEK